jgi:hypothetical protein
MAINIKNLTVRNFIGVDQITNIKLEFYHSRLLLKIYQNL